MINCDLRRVHNVSCMSSELTKHEVQQQLLIKDANLVAPLLLFLPAGTV